MTTSAHSSRSATGSMLFAATLMVLAGLFQVFQGIAGIAHDHIFISTGAYTYKFDTTAWGWIHLIIGIVVMVTGFFVFTAAPWARAVGVVLVAVQALASFFFLPYYPIWALTILALDIFVIWALATGPGHRTTYDQYERNSSDIRDEPTAGGMRA